ncbi:MAG: hypothetical protein ACK5HR_02165 [Mycoplasmatales bacterium]
MNNLKNKILIISLMFVINIIIIIMGEIIYAPVIYFILTIGVATLLVLSKNQKIDIASAIGKVIIICFMINLIIITIMLMIALKDSGAVILICLPLLLIGYSYIILKTLNYQKYEQSKIIKDIFKVDILIIVATIIGSKLGNNLVQDMRVLGIGSNYHIIQITISMLIFTIPYMYVLNKESKGYKKEVLSFGIVIMIMVIVMIPNNSLKPQGEVIEVTSCSELSNLSNTGRYVLQNDIDCQGQSINNEKIFNGELVGNKHQISNLSNTMFEKVGGNGIISEVQINKYQGESIVQENYGNISEIAVSASEIKGKSQVGVVGINKGVMNNIEVREGTNIYGDSYTGSVVGTNKGEIDHTYSSGNIYNTAGKQDYGEYTGMIVGQQVDNSATKHTVYSGDTYIPNANIISGSAPEYQEDVKAANTCIKKIDKEHKGNMREIEYNYLLGYEDPEDQMYGGEEYRGKILKEYEQYSFGECVNEQNLEPTNGQRRVSYLAQDEENIVDIGEDKLGIAELKKEYVFLKDEDYLSETPMNFEQLEKIGLPPIPMSYGVSFILWELGVGYDIWYVEKATGINYTALMKTVGVKEVLFYGNFLGFNSDGNIWEWNEELGAATLIEF